MLSKDLHADLKTCLAEEYTNEAIPSDGQIYYQMRFYHFQHNFSMEMRWKARLRGNREEYLQTLENHLAVREAFDALLYVPGLWDGMRISTLHTVMALNCDSVGWGQLEGKSADFVITATSKLPPSHQAGLVRHRRW